MINKFAVKPMFKDQIHERYHFKLNMGGNNYQGIFHKGEILWFHPQPKNKLDDDELQDLEYKVNNLMTNLLNNHRI